VSEAGIDFLASYYNMTVYYFRYDAIPNGRSFLLDINPNFRHRGLDDWQNAIDARWVDMSSGLYIDITAARYTLLEEEGEGMLYDKSGHRYRVWKETNYASLWHTRSADCYQDTYLYPLLDTTFEGAPAKIPYRYKEMLASEYSELSLTKTHFEG
jgi:hypothetical protein